MSYLVQYTDRTGQPRESQSFGTRQRAEEFVADLLAELPNQDLRCRNANLLAPRVVDKSIEVLVGDEE